ncbi:hypothetical protein FEI17_27105 (plasmid) [Kosakonia radicincitans]|uniref:hypothetical protein n=1 Tax=Kosakonia radicincitans TaxID=283686 RepID=UPI0011EFDDC6|nr:hypothetical protein [Kosakonia radicincitans]QEM94304.1 hypothetical protein FEI17_27105 [Kosakonia radicincitans]
MKKDRNAKVLRQIRSDINQWRAGGFPPGKRLFLFVWGLPTLGGFWLVMNSSAKPAVSALIFALISGVALIFATVVTAAAPKTWSETLDKRLSTYQPQNLVAWNYLQKTASKKGKLEVHDLERWYESEAITACPRVKKPLRFLNHRPETKDTESLK